MYKEAFNLLPDSLKPKESDNEFIVKAQIGHRLFFDTQLSINGTKSCASCHNPNLYFTDGYKRALGVYADVQLRNTPSIINSVFFKTLNWANPDIDIFEKQMTVPLFSKTHFEMGMNENDNEQAIKILEKYSDFAIATKQKNKNWAFIVQCITCYEKLLISRHSKYDLFEQTKDSSVFSTNEKEGLRLFFSSKTNCSKCHGGIDFNTPQLLQNYFSNTGVYTAKEYLKSEDRGVFNSSKNSEDIGKFRIPSLRNVTKTAPYMHDGSFLNLNEVIAHYTKRHNDELLKGFSITEQERNNLLAFLETLTDTTVLVNTLFRKP